MTLISTTYNGAPDLYRMQNLIAQSIQKAGDCGYLHVGDIPHRIYNARRRQPNPDPTVFTRLWQDPNGVLMGFAILYPHWRAFNLQVHADHRGGEAEITMIYGAQQGTWDLMEQYDIEGDTVGCMDVYDCDVTRIALLEQVGYTRADPAIVLTSRSLEVPIPDAPLPPGYSIRSAAGVHEALALGEVHAGAFISPWTEEGYRAVMESPGYILENELVVVAPDGRFAAFTINWFDMVNKTGLFEPVGTHRDFQRQGMGRALMTYALRRMKSMGIQTAYVGHEPDNPASSGLYAAMGFRPRYTLYDYQRQMV